MRLVYLMGMLAPGICVGIGATLWVAEERYDEGFEDGKKYVREIMFQQVDSVQKLFPDNPRYQSIVDGWYKDGILPVKE